ncbi:MAG: IgGFc-binding protein, partial [Acidobacteriota bacterium]
MRVTLALLVAAIAACGPGARNRPDAANGGGGDASCANTCSPDLRDVLDCQGNVVTACAASDQCDTTSVVCENACAAADANHRSVGCDYYATYMDSEINSYCFAVFVANTWTQPAHVTVEYGGQTLTPATFTRLPSGAGPTLTLQPYDPVAGIAPNDVAILFLGGSQGAAPACPVPSAVTSPSITGTGLSQSFHVTTDVPVVAYEINPYGGGSAAVTGASLLIPTSAWDTSYVAVNVSPSDIGFDPSLNIVASRDGTQVTLNPVAAVTGNAGVPSGAANQPMTITLNKGQNAQITQPAELTGSSITSNFPIGFMAGQPCMRWPTGTTYCDHGEQMVPPVHALGNEYVGVGYRPRVASETQYWYRLIGAVDGTQLVYSAAVGGPATLNKGQSVTFLTGTPFTVASQDTDHPFMMFTYMSSSGAASDGYGDPDFVLDVPPQQFLSSYVFFADPTYPETNLVVVRAPDMGGNFHEVVLDCFGPLTGWTTVGNYQWARADLMTGDFHGVGNCSTGRHEIHSDAPFGLQVWGWGTPQTSTFTANVSYGYPGGMNV